MNVSRAHFGLQKDPRLPVPLSYWLCCFAHILKWLLFNVLEGEVYVAWRPRTDSLTGTLTGILTGTKVSGHTTWGFYDNFSESEANQA
jgi:hypothetical protein